jgi:Barstar (barnase inhibitor)
VSSLSERLKDIGEPGVYRLNGEIEELRKAAKEAGAALFEADLAKAKDTPAFIHCVAAAIHAPDWFHANWDALADVLGDLSWQPAPAYILLLRRSNATLNLPRDEYGIASEILSGTMDYWKSRNTPFWVFLAD